MLSHFEATVLRGRPSLSVEKGVDAIFSVRSEVETVSTETISKSFSIPLLSSEDVNVLSPTPYARSSIVSTNGPFFKEDFGLCNVPRRYEVNLLFGR